VQTRSALIEEFKQRYIWWRDGTDPSEDRIVAQVMELGTYEDIRRLEAVLSADQIAELMRRAQPGWISPRSWNFWRGRLQGRGASMIPAAPPRRSFYDAAS
jgi:hypothetical protein